MGCCVVCRRELYPLVAVDPFTLEQRSLKGPDMACCARLTHDGFDYEVVWCRECCPTDHTQSAQPIGRVRRLWWRFLDMLSGRYPWSWEKTQSNED